MGNNLVFLCLFLSLIGVLMMEEGGSDLEFVKSVNSNGYPVEIHKVETEDGYILTIFRIPHGRYNNNTNPHSVLINHGMLGSAENYIYLGPNRSLAYVLADNGYDVWLMNSRGALYSREHKIYRPEQKEFWQFSWHEIGVYDIPACIDYILKETNDSGVNYIGHSQGCTTVFVMGSERPEYNEKIKLMIGLAPGAFYGNIRNPYFKVASRNLPMLQRLAESLNIYTLPPPFIPVEELRETLNLVCAKSKALQKTCLSLFILITGVNAQTFDKNDIPHILPFIIAPISVKQAFHYGQLIASGNFQQYDFGTKINYQKYGSPKPPLYNIKNITFPGIIIFSSADDIATEKDVKRLASQLPNLVEMYEIPNKNFTHIDYLVATNINNLVNNKIVKWLNKYNTNTNQIR